MLRSEAISVYTTIEMKTKKLLALVIWLITLAEIVTIKTVYSVWIWIAFFFWAGYDAKMKYEDSEPKGGEE